MVVKVGEVASQLWSLGQQGAWSDVARLAKALREESPGEPLGFLRGAHALRLLGRYDEAETVIRDAIERFPDDHQPLVEAALTAQARSDWRGVVRWSARLVEQFPSQVAGYRTQSYGHRCLREFADAQRVLSEGARRFPDDLGLKLEGCWLAIGQEQWDLAGGRCAALTRTHPTVEAGYQVALLVLKRLRRFAEATDLLARAQDSLGSKAWIRVESLRLAQQESPEKALDLALRIVASHPDQTLAYEIAASALRQQGKLDEAERLLQRAVDTLPPDPGVHTERAWVAQDRGDWLVVDERWAQARHIFPQDRNIALWYGRSRALPFRPLQPGDVVDAHRRYDEIHAQFPDLAAAYADHIQMYSNANCLPEAEAIARAACEKMPGDAQIRFQYSQAAAARGDAATALARLVEVKDRFSDQLLFQCRLVAALAVAEQFDEAEEACAALVARYADQDLAYIESAELAMRRHDWSAAVDRWKAANARFPGNARIQKGLFEAEYASIEVDHHAPERIEVDDDEGRAPRIEARDGEVPIQEIVVRFESLAGTFQGCEFGAVQRYFGCEPLGFFRWGQIDAEDVISAIESGLDGVGEPEQTELFVNKVEGAEARTAEYVVGDLRFGMRSHTFIRASEMPHDMMWSQSLRRLKFLKRKFLEDLGEAQKIFVYKRGHAILLKEQALRLTRAVCAYNPDNQVLCVHLATREGQAGTVERVTANLLAGYVSHFTLTPGRKETTRRPAYSEWESICRSAHALWQHRGSSS